jgi:hypothetical protein
LVKEIKIPEGYHACSLPHTLPEHHVGPCSPTCRAGEVMHLHRNNSPTFPPRSPITREVILTPEEAERVSVRRGLKSRQTRRAGKYFESEMATLMPIRIPAGVLVEGVPILEEGRRRRVRRGGR